MLHSLRPISRADRAKVQKAIVIFAVIVFIVILFFAAKSLIANVDILEVLKKIHGG